MTTLFERQQGCHNVKTMSCAWWDSLKRRAHNTKRRLFWMKHIKLLLHHLYLCPGSSFSSNVLNNHRNNYQNALPSVQTKANVLSFKSAFLCFFWNQNSFSLHSLTTKTLRMMRYSFFLYPWFKQQGKF